MSEEITLFKDPYALGTYNKDTHGRIYCDISKADYQFLQLILPSRRDAVIQTTFSILAKKLIETLKLYGITTINDANRYKQFILDVDFRNGRTPDRVMPTADAPDERRTTPGVRDTKPSNKNVSTDVSSEIKRVKRSKTGKK